MIYEKEGEVLEKAYWIGGVFCDKGSMVWTIREGSREILHREDGPATIIIYKDGSCNEMYWLRGKRHNENGAAIIFYTDGRKVYYEAYWLDNKFLFNVKEVSEIGKDEVNKRFEEKLKEYWAKEMWG